ncbi:maltase-glucoamylase-like isoform X1 [Pieris napi]|uniref:maltase-glucoamylase-like isoform X1 n=2 Tax=Pieris napi TaxID=78633 RepID=UPI001FBA4C72|nr:maltase-glucoamylase-like isoform X1 [Pieris napi]
MNTKVDDTQSNYEDTENLNYSYDGIKQLKWYEHVILNRPLQVFVGLVLVAVLVPLILYQFHFIPSGGFQLSVGSCLVPQTSRLPCGPGNVSERECHAQCCYDVKTGFCFHRLPSRFSYIMDVPWSQYLVLYPRVSTIPYNSKASLRNLRLSINERTATHLTIHFYNGKEPLRAGQRLYNKTYSYTVSSPELNIEVKGPQGTIFNTIRGPLIASDGIWEVTFQLTNATMYGLGELPLTSGTTKVIYSHNKDFSSIPLIFAKYNGSYHGLLLDTPAPTEIMVRDENEIIVRSLTGTGLKFHLFVGPTPKDIMNDAMNLIGSNWKLEYWMLGAHICGTSDTDLNNYINTLTAANIPFESHCGHRPIVLGSNRCEDTEVKNLQDVDSGANLIRQARKRFVPHISPYIRFNEDTTTLKTPACTILPEFDLFMYHDPHTFEIYKGEVGEVKVMYPAYDVASIHFLKRLWPFTNKFDGLIIENNWPLDQSNKSAQDPSPYLDYYNENFKAALTNTPTWNMTLIDKTKYFFKHNTYGEESVKAIMNMTGHGIVPAVSNHWMNGNVMIHRQNIDALWLNLHRELIQAALGGISGHWLWSSPICGDNKFFPENQTDLCAKWYMASTYFPLVRIDANTPARDPTAFNGNYRNYMVTALNRRLAFIPYFYTVLQQGPLLRPMFYQYPQADYFEKTNSQFSVGDDLLIVPNLHVMQSYVHVTMPPGTWYEIWGGERVNVTEGKIATMPTLESDFLTLIRGGSIIALQNEIHGTAESTRKNSLFSIVIALQCLNATSCSASGEVYFLPELTLKFRATHEKLYVTAEGDDFSTMCNFPNNDIMEDAGDIKIFGLEPQFNNYDTYRHFEEYVMFCDLEVQDVIEVNLI